MYNLFLTILVSILSYGAKGDGETLNTHAFNSAIEACAQQGGGVVEVPEGTFLSGTIHLKTGVTLQLQKGAVILGSKRLSDYESFVPKHDLSRYESGRGTANANSAYDTIWTKALVIANDIHDAGITGEGTIDGQHVFNPLGEEKMRGPHTIIAASCQRLTFSHFNVCHAANYAFLAYDISDSHFSNLTITEGWDGIHIRGCERVNIRNCVMHTGDDGIAGGYWHKMVIDGNEINSSCNGIRMIQPSVDLAITNNHIYGPGLCKHRTSGKTSSDAAISLEPGGWGAAPGRLDSIIISNLKTETVLTPVSVTLSEDNTAGTIIIENVVARDITRMAMSVKSWGSAHTDKVIVRNVDLQFRGIDDPSLPKWFKTAKTSEWPFFPSWAMYFRNVGSVSIENAKLSHIGADYRKAIIYNNVGKKKEKNLTPAPARSKASLNDK